MSDLTGKPVRDIGFLAWENDLAWMEFMKGKRWNALLRREKSYWNALTQQPKVHALTNQFLKEFQTYVAPRIHCGTLSVDGVIDIQFQSGGLSWNWKWSTHSHAAIAVDTDGTHTWYTTVLHGDVYRYKMICETMDGTIRWIKEDTSVDFVIKDGLMYYIRLDYPFNTTGLFVCDAYTGKHEERIYLETNPERFIEIVQGSNKSLFCKSGTWSESKTWEIHGKTLKRIYKDSVFQYPYDYDNAMTIEGPDFKEILYGTRLKSLELPPEKYSIQWINIRTGHLITMMEGEHTLWYCQPHKHPEKLYSIIAGDMDASIWSYWHNEDILDIFIKSPFNPPYILQVVKNHIIPDIRCFSPTAPLPTLDASRYSTYSADGTRVSYLLVKQKDTIPKKLLCYVYGAYGSASVVMWPYMQWAPLLTRGWAIAYSFSRGSGDRNDKWMRAGQARNHIKTIEDFEAIIRNVQYKLHIPPNKTVIYGRSAGGLMVGGTTARNPDGRLMGATFTEVPFVDAIRSQTNPELPLVQSGFSEYGNPIKSIVDFKALLNISPMNSLPADGAPGVFVVCRTGLKDLQVMPFEPVKWVQRLRGQAKPPAGKFLAFEKDEAHVYSGKRYYQARSSDLAILELWANGTLPIPSFLRE